MLTVLVDLTVAIGVGMVLAAFLFIRRMARSANVNAVTRERRRTIATRPTPRARRVPAGVEVYEINGPFFFGAAETFKDTLARVAGKPRVLVMRMRGVPVLDSTGMHALKDVVHRSRREGTMVLLCECSRSRCRRSGGSVLLDGDRRGARAA